MFKGELFKKLAILGLFLIYFGFFKQHYNIYNK